MDKPRIAILGGGAGAVSAALQLSKPGWKDHFESITLYQQGWRLGGKGACGRGQDLRIEEHGLHLWFGFYENAFQLLNRAHEELDSLAEGDNPQPRWDLAFKDVETSFSRLDHLAVADHDGCSWKLWLADLFDDDDDRPWLEPDPRDPDERPDRWSVVFYLVRCLRLAADVAGSLTQAGPELEISGAPGGEPAAGPADLDDAVELLRAALGGDIQRLLDAAAELLDALAEEAFDERTVRFALGMVVRALDAGVDFTRRRYDEFVRYHDSARRAYYVVDLLLAVVRGAIEDDVVEHDSFDAIEDVDLRDWLLAHGAARESIDCGLIRGIVYDLGFAYEDGDPQRPSCAAGTALRGLLRAFFTYRGSLMWRMNSGMGDVVFLPFYELLSKRGVDIRFFHRVEQLRVAGGRVQEIEIDVQAEVAPGLSPEDWVTKATATTPTPVWPADPGPLLDSNGPPGLPATKYESWYAGRADSRVGQKTLVRGAAGADGFELVVFGLPVSCVLNVAPQLTTEPRWKDAVDHLRTVPTQAMQLWLNTAATDLADVDSGIVVSGFVEPYDTWADMPQLVARENVPGSKTVAYFCNVLADSAPPVPGQEDAWFTAQNELVKQQALRFLTHDVGSLWPAAVDTASRAFKWGLLVAPGVPAGPARLDEQYLRANVEPSERYVLSVPGSSRYRIKPDDTGFENLYAVGDWTACGLNAGYVEGAVISGMLAANAIHRRQKAEGRVDSIIGFEGP